MKAATITAYDSPFRINTVYAPQHRALASNELRIKMLYAGFNPVDWKVRKGFLKAIFPLEQFKGETAPESTAGKIPTTTTQKVPPTSEPDLSEAPYMILGSDFCGEIMEVGKDVVGFAKGDLVCGAHRYGRHFVGTFAEQAIVRDDETVRVPKEFSPKLAACIGVAGLTAFQCLEKIADSGERDSLRGKSVVIIGASGGVGSFATLFAKHYFGAYVYAICSGKNCDYLKTLGADEQIDYTQVTLEDFWRNKPKEEFARLLGIIDAIGNDKYRHDSVKVLGAHSEKKYVTPVVQRDEKSLSVSKGLEFAAQQFYKNVLSKLGASCSMHVIIERKDNKRMEDLLQFIQDHHLTKKVYAKSYPLEEIQLVDEMSEGGHVRGKIVLRIGSQK